MQKRISFFLLALMALTFAGACIWSVAGAQEKPPAEPTPYVLEQQIMGQNGFAQEVFTPTGTVEISPVELKRLQDAAAAELANAREVFVSGPETIGGVVEIAGKQIQLPPNVYSEAFVVALTCEKECPETPYYVLRYTDSDTSVLVGARSGKISAVGGIEEAKAQTDRVAFQWLADALAKEGVPQ